MLCRIRRAANNVLEWLGVLPSIRNRLEPLDGMPVIKRPIWNAENQWNTNTDQPDLKDDDEILLNVSDDSTDATGNQNNPIEYEFCELLTFVIHGVVGCCKNLAAFLVLERGDRVSSTGSGCRRLWKELWTWRGGAREGTLISSLFSRTTTSYPRPSAGDVFLHSLWINY